MLLGEMAVVPEPRIEKECERFFDLHQTENGAFSYDSKIRSENQHDEPYLTGNMIRALLALGYGKDPRARKAIE